MNLAPPKLGDPKKILIVLHGSIGDVTRALPLAGMLRKRFPQVYLAWSVEPACYPLLQGNAAIDEVLLFDRQRWLTTFGRFLSEVRARRFDLVLDLQRHLKSGLISWWSRAPQRLGFHRGDSKEFNWWFNNRHIPQCGEGMSKLDHYLKFAEYLGIDNPSIAWDFALTPAEHAAVDNHLKGIAPSFAVLFVGTRWQSKNLFPAQIAGCADLLQTAQELDVVLLGGAQDHSVAQAVMEKVSSQITNLAGRTSLREAIGIIERAKIAIGPDTGLMHIAAAVGTPVVSLWGATDPVRTGPYRSDHLVIRGQAPCSPCYRRSCNIGRVCMQSITADQIDAKLRLVLGQRTADRGAHAECG
jgi:lipopolysaccharide heptosyltransferase II